MINHKNYKIQDSVTFNRRKKSLGVNVKVMIFLFLCLFVVAVVLSVIAQNKANQVFLQQKIYVVYAEKSNNKNNLDKISENIKKYGGAGVIAVQNSVYYAVINVYNSEEDASEVLQTTKKYYANAGVCEFTGKKINKKIVKQLKNSECHFSFFEYAKTSFDKLILAEMDYMVGELTLNGLCTEILKMKLKLEDYIQNMKGKEDFLCLFETSNLMLLHYNNFLDNIFISKNKQSLLSEFVSNIGFCYLETHNNL